MPNAPFTGFKGFLPIDARKIDQPHVIRGENFMLNADGPYSAFGNDIVSYTQFSDPEFIETFRVESENFIFAKGSIWGYDAFSDTYYPVMTFTDAGETFPWSEAFVGNVYYFAKKGVGLISYTPTTGEWKSLDGVGSVPTGVVAVADASGRLIAVTATNIHGSAFDDGEDFVTSPQTGAFAQSLGLVRGGEPYAVRHTSSGGYMVFTSEGMIVATFTDTIIPFSHKGLTEHAKPISPFGVLDADDLIIILNEDGFWQTRGQEPEPWQPLMSEFFRQTLLPNILDSNPEAIRLHYNSPRKWIIISVAELNQPSLYTKAYVYYIPLDEWGIFNSCHHGFGTLDLQSGPFEGRHFGFVCQDGYLRKFTDQPRIEPVPDLGELYLYHQEMDIPSRLVDGVHIATSNIYMPENNETFFDTVGGSSGAYTTLDGEPTGNYLPAYESVNSFIDIGLFRFVEQQAPNEMSIVTEVAIGQDSEAVLVFEEEDWNALTGEEDWNILTGEEDWGFDIVATVDYVASILGTVDGKNVWEDQQEVMQRHQHTDKDSGGNTLEKLETQYFICYNNGIYHIIRISAQNVGESFHLKTLDISGFVDGVL